MSPLPNPFYDHRKYHETLSEAQEIRGKGPEYAGAADQMLVAAELYKMAREAALAFWFTLLAMIPIALGLAAFSVWRVVMHP